MISLKPSEELSEPRLLRWFAPGMGNALAWTGEVERWYGVACCLVGWNWPLVWTTVVVAPGEGDLVLAVIVRVALEAS
jgi:hypothetical protein